VNAFPIWVYVAVAAVIALAAFAVGQIASGAGGMVVAIAAPMWVVYSVRFQRKAGADR
jgi:hypothetical protein